MSGIHRTAAEKLASRMVMHTVNFTADQSIALQEHSDRTGRTRAALIREAVDAWLASNAVTVVEGE